MTLPELFILALGLAMDAFAVSVCKGLALGKIKGKHCIIAGVWFGGFQALMPVIGYILGSRFEQYITSVDHWIAFVLLAAIGGNMLREACSCGEEEADPSMSFKTMLVMALATSIDALAVGITFACLKVELLSAVSLIGGITFLLSALGVKVGSVFGARFRRKAEAAGGIILILMGLKILLEHLGIISF